MCSFCVMLIRGRYLLDCRFHFSVPPVNHALFTYLMLWNINRYRQFLSLHQAVGENVRAEDMPHLPGKRILGSSVHPSFAEARGLALQVNHGRKRQKKHVSTGEEPCKTGCDASRVSRSWLQTRISSMCIHIHLYLYLMMGESWTIFWIAMRMLFVFHPRIPSVQHHNVMIHA